MVIILIYLLQKKKKEEKRKLKVRQIPLSEPLIKSEAKTANFLVQLLNEILLTDQETSINRYTKIKVDTIMNALKATLLSCLKLFGKVTINQLTDESQSKV